MRPAVIRLIVTVLLFAGWLSYLGYLVWESKQSPTGKPIVLSRPQFLVSEVDIIGTVRGEGPMVHVDEVLYPSTQADLVETEIKVTNLSKCRPPGRTTPDLNGEGPYIMPLQLIPGSGDKDKTYQVAPLPPLPSERTLQAGPPHVYPVTKDTRAQLREIESKKPE
jgi:hypothetical protein